MATKIINSLRVNGTTHTIKDKNAFSQTVEVCTGTTSSPTGKDCISGNTIFIHISKSFTIASGYGYADLNGGSEQIYSKAFKGNGVVLIGNTCIPVSFSHAISDMGISINSPTNGTVTNFFGIGNITDAAAMGNPFAFTDN